ncbi:MAG: bifunctional UDP-N-acetylmuramoyl-tripeptide:D-alanyl-D-alanine ligase/alanine racemase [Bacteroidales bacterium]|nr:bifunctional UDP-N-acetylmuramoyl-tripeptide:D-alanyl-D-alanine ligase/alanine racemase [Bacteroidales bacterium]
MIAYTIQEIAAAVSGRITGDKNDLIKTIFTDSRTQHTPDETLFIALKGQRHDGHHFIPALYQKGVRNFMVADTWEPAQSYPEASCIHVRDTLFALQELAAYHRSHFPIEVIGITGSNGKTIIKEWLFQCLQEKWHITRSPKSYNSQVGVPLSVLLLDKNSEMGIFEAGISTTGEMKRLQPVIRPTLGLFTNIGEAHQEGFPGHEQKVEEKLKLFTDCRAVICSKDHSLIWQGIQQHIDRQKTRIFTWSVKEDSDVRLTKISINKGITNIKAIHKKKPVEIDIPFTDNASVENAIHVWSVLLFLDLDPGYIRSRMLCLTPVAMRLEQKSGINNCILINDSYNADINSLAIALDVLNRTIQQPDKTLVLSDIMQSGKKTKDLYIKVADLVKEKRVSRIIGVGPDINANSHLFNIPGAFYKTTQELLDHLASLNFHNEVILLKGSRSFEFEKISAQLEQKVHTTRLEINLDALVHNLNYYRSRLPAGTRIMIMVKALSYGSGTHEIASLLQFQKVDYLGVAFADEGVSLRQAGITLPILVMSPEPGSFEILLKYQLEPEIYSLRMLDHFNQAVIRNQEIAYPVHIKIDTGMHRLGFKESDIPQLLEQLKKCHNLKVNSVFSHLAAADEEVHDSFTEEQIKRFEKTADKLSASLGYPVIRHVLNSSGIERFPHACFDMVRLGIGLYGISSYSQQQLRNVSSLKSQISQIKTIEPGESVGYGRKGAVTRKTVIAVVPVGYADGLNRMLGNGNGSFFINGKPAPIIGNICMDMTMADITGIEAHEGDDVIVFGDHYPVSRLAEQVGTIPYEILTGISSRVKRVYFHE